MPRPRKCRRIGFKPGVDFFKPRGVPVRDLEHVTVSLEAIEALRLADLEGMTQEQGARRMGISRQTFGRILEEAHRTVAEALVKGKAIRIEGGTFELVVRRFRCEACDHSWELPFGTGRPRDCPSCGDRSILRVDGRRRHRHRGGRNRDRSRT